MQQTVKYLICIYAFKFENGLQVQEAGHTILMKYVASI